MTIPAAVAGLSPQPNNQKAGADRRFGGPCWKEIRIACVLLAKAHPASGVRASRLRAALPIWTHPTVSVSLGGLPFTDARMPALEPKGTFGNLLGRGSCTNAKMDVSSLQLSQVDARQSIYSLVHRPPLS